MIARSHDTFFGNERTQIEATPALIIERGEKVYLPPARVYQGTADEWTTVELAQRFAADYRGAGGTVDLQLLQGERHTFVNEHPFCAQLSEGAGDSESVHQEIQLGEIDFALIAIGGKLRLAVGPAFLPLSGPRRCSQYG